MSATVEGVQKKIAVKIEKIGLLIFSVIRFMARTDSTDHGVDFLLLQASGTAACLK